MIASTKAHASTTNAATASATKKYWSGAYAPLPIIETTSKRYLVLGRIGSRLLLGFGRGRHRLPDD